jgi:Spy/CpxP family protein refolding chaperone
MTRRLPILLICFAFALPTFADDPPKPTIPARPQTPAKPDAPPRPNRALTLADRVKTAIADLGLSDTQKARIESLITEVEKKTEDLRAAGGDNVREKLVALRDETVHTIKSILSEEQYKKFEQALSRAAPPPAGTRIGALIQRFQDGVKKLELTDEQKTKLESVLADARKTLDDELRPLLRPDQPPSAELREKIRALTEDLRAKVQELLTPEQQQKLRELMQTPQPPRERPKAEN